MPEATSHVTLSRQQHMAGIDLHLLQADDTSGTHWEARQRVRRTPPASGVPDHETLANCFFEPPNSLSASSMYSISVIPSLWGKNKKEQCRMETVSQKALTAFRASRLPRRQPSLSPWALPSPHCQIWHPRLLWPLQAQHSPWLLTNSTPWDCLISGNDSTQYDSKAHSKA